MGKPVILDQTFLPRFSQQVLHWMSIALDEDGICQTTLIIIFFVKRFFVKIFFVKIFFVKSFFVIIFFVNLRPHVGVPRDLVSAGGVYIQK